MDARRPAKPILSDPFIIPRVKQYLEENVHQTYVDVGVMARHLQEKYREYGRRKLQPFRFLVDQAYKTVLHSYGLESNPSTEDEENSDVELMEEPPAQRNNINNMLTDLYRTNTAAREATASNENPIDISSDESDGESTNKNTDNNQIQKDSVKAVKDAASTSKNNSTADTFTVNRDDSNKAKPPSIVSSVMSPSIPKKRKIDNNDIPLRVISKNPPSRQSSKRFNKEFMVKIPEYTFDNLGGIDKTLKELCELLLMFKHPHIYKKMGLPAPKGLLLHGPPGCGKTMLAQAIAGQLKVRLIQVAATELISGVSGESEQNIRDLFEQATFVAPCVLFIDEIDAISSNRLNAQKDMERRIVSQLITSLDQLPQLAKGDQVLVIGATNRVETLDPSLRRVCRFDQEICLGIPDREARCKILRVVCKDLRLESFFDYDTIALLTPGYVGADLLALATRAGILAIKRIVHEKQENALKKNVGTTTVNRHSNGEPTDINLSDALIMQIDGDAMKNDASINVPSNSEVMEISMENLERETNQNANDIEPDNDPVMNQNVVDEDKNEINNSPATPQSAERASDSISPTNKSKHSSPINSVILSVETSPKETLGEAMLKNDEIKSQLSFDVMFEWMSDTNPLVSEDDLKDMYITLDDFKDAIKLIQPSAKREGFITVPDVTWDDIGSLQDIREELSLAILAPVKFPNRLKSLGINAPSGILLCGPPGNILFVHYATSIKFNNPKIVDIFQLGCGKTLLAKAIANEAGINFISVKGPELLNMYVGESERAVRQCFQRARNSTPCVIFFDEFDALCPKRTSNENSGSSRVVNQLLTEMDGVEDRIGVFIMAATNRPDMIDPAVLRPGRLDKIVFVNLPEKQDRLEILQAQTKQRTRPRLADDVSLEEIAELTDTYTGADLAGLVRQASFQALKESLVNESTSDTDIELFVNKGHFLSALKHLRPSVSADDKARYEKLRLKYTAVEQQPE